MMKYFLILTFLFFGLNESFGQRKRSEVQTKSSLAIKYYNSKDYDKAIPLLKEVHKLTGNLFYLRYCINSLIALKRYSEAEEILQKEIKKKSRPEYHIYWGKVLKEQGKLEEAEAKFSEAITQSSADKGSYITLANAFLTLREYEYSKQVYLEGRKKLGENVFNYELARAYLYLRNYEKMMEEYLNLLKQDEKQLGRVQGALASVMRLDIDDGLRNKFRKQILKRIQLEPQIIGYNRLLIWFLLQEKKFSSALRQSIALDKRTQEETQQIAQLGIVALRNKKYSKAREAFQYLMDKGKSSSFYTQAYAQSIHASYLEYTTNNADDKEKGAELANMFAEGLAYLNYGPATLFLVREYAHLLAFYLNDTEKALLVLQRGLKIQRLKTEQIGKLKMEQADIYVYANDPWEAMLIYAQVIDANKNALGDDAKLKKAKLGYYMGNFNWAKAQLDVLKASTSKLIANDAMDLSMMIGSNLNLDTTAIPLTLFAKADLLFFQNREDQAMQVLDSIAEIYPYHTLVDDILFRKAKIEIENQNYAVAAKHLEAIVEDFSFELLADNALFMLAELYHYNLGEEEKAKDLYKQMLSKHPGSVFVEESRLQYRELRKIYPDKENNSVDNLFQRAIENTEF